MIDKHNALLDAVDQLVAWEQQISAPELCSIRNAPPMEARNFVIEFSEIYTHDMWCEDRIDIMQRVDEVVARLQKS